MTAWKKEETVWQFAWFRAAHWNIWLPAGSARNTFSFIGIPSFCGEGFYGLKVHEAALEYGVKVTGATVHFVNEIPDGGKIIAQKAVEILEGDTPETLQKRVMENAEWIILPKAAEIVSQKMLEDRK